MHYDVSQRIELNVTLRDASKARIPELDFVRKSWDADRLTRPIDLHRRWSYVSEVRLQKRHLVWRQAEPKRVGNHWLLDGEVARRAITTRREAEQAGRGVLDEFLRLADGTEKAILGFAQTWGVLELCGHNLPSCHEFSLGVPLRLPDPRPSSDRHGGCSPSDPRQCLPLRREPLTTWRFFSAQAAALLNIAANLQRVWLGEDADWDKMLRDGVAPARSVGAQRLCLQDMIEGWLRLGRVKPTIDDLTGALTWTGADLFGELAVQIALAAKALDGQILCVACGKAYQPKRLVVRRGFNYCAAVKCQREAAAQRAKRYRDRKLGGQGSLRELPYRGAFQGRTDDPLFSQ
jgi:hypothetical protein